MLTQTVTGIVVFLSSVSAYDVAAMSAVRPNEHTKGSKVTIVQKGLEVTTQTLTIRYEITNASEEDLWLCEGLTNGVTEFESWVIDNGDTLLLRRRLGPPWREMIEEWPSATYVRVPGGQTREEALVLPFLAYHTEVFRLPVPGTKTAPARQIRVELGFYLGDLPKMVLDRCTQAYRQVDTRQEDISDAYLELLWLNHGNEHISSREDRIQLYVPGMLPEVESVLRMVIDSANVSLTEKYWQARRAPNPPDLHSCKHLELIYEPSMLECLFPYPSQQHLLSSSERDDLKSQKKIVVEDRERIAALTKVLDRGCFAGIVAGGPSVRLNWTGPDGEPSSLTLFNDKSLQTPDGRCFYYRRGIKALHSITPLVKSLELRLGCAAQLKNLWYRMRLYHLAESRGGQVPFADDTMRYPTPETWSKTLIEATSDPGMILADEETRRCRCPSAGEGRCHYAMNPNCAPNSPVDTVLLFETGSGWNQHGGMELFTFDNHDPKGGCVLFNDGSVKFIRTEEELRALRWR